MSHASTERTSLVTSLLSRIIWKVRWVYERHSTCLAMVSFPEDSIPFYMCMAPSPPGHLLIQGQGPKSLFHALNFLGCYINSPCQWSSMKYNPLLTLKKQLLTPAPPEPHHGASFILNSWAYAPRPQGSASSFSGSRFPPSPPLAECAAFSSLWGYPPEHLQ